MLNHTVFRLCVGFSGDKIHLLPTSNWVSNGIYLPLGLLDDLDGKKFKKKINTGSIDQLRRSLKPSMMPENGRKLKPKSFNRSNHKPIEHVRTNPSRPNFSLHECGMEWSDQHSCRPGLHFHRLARKDFIQNQRKGRFYSGGFGVKNSSLASFRTRHVETLFEVRRSKSHQSYQGAFWNSSWLHDIHELNCSFSSVFFYVIPRKDNITADCLAKEALNNSSDIL